jgi:DNA-binding transcriptional MerR regulator
MPQDTEQISKKDLLERTGISYGQLYRWKRKGLIPEEWFVKKAAFTGQETFFPRAEILERVERIQGMKDDINLDQLASLLSPRPSPLQLTAAELRSRNIVTAPALELLAETLAPIEPLGFDLIFFVWVVDRLLGAGDISRAEAALILRTLAAGRGPEAQGQLLFLRKHGVGFALLAQGAVVLDPEARVVARIDLPAQVAQLKLTLNGGKP